MLPLCWDNMTPGENLEMFALQPLCPEYLSVKKAFSQTAKQTVLKVGGKLSETHYLFPKTSLVTGFTLSLHRSSVCRMSISDVPTKCRRNASLIRTDWRAALVRSCCTTEQQTAIPS